MRKVLSLGLMVATALGLPVSSSAAVKATGQQGGAVNGVAQGADKQPLPNYSVRVRSMSDGTVAGTTTSNATGQFSFASLQPGNYVVEIVNAAGQIVGLSPTVAVAAGATVTVTVGATATGALAAAAGGGVGLFGLGAGATVAVVTAAGVATVAGVVAAKKDASPSR